MPGWMLLQMSAEGKVVEYPDILCKKGISDHSPIQVTLKPAGSIPASERPVAPEVCEHPDYV
eukprot:2665593-Pyramimonas_sp.AAC.1